MSSGDLSRAGSKPGARGPAFPSDEAKLKLKTLGKCSRGEAAGCMLLSPKFPFRRPPFLQLLQLHTDVLSVSRELESF